ncbi:hypothetical protein WKH82_17975 [Acinetobacter baumannii]|nr:hypothetical protein [Acinetobacter baumannii]
MKTLQRPTVRVEDRAGGDKDQIYEHPAFAVIRVSNPQGHRVLFGSDVEHNDYIELEIATADLKRSLHSDWIHGDTRPIISVAMSHAQFVSMIQSSGKGAGTPCTLQYAPVDRNKNVERVPQIEPLQSKAELTKDEIQRDAAKALELAKKAIDALDRKVEEVKSKKSVTKKDLSDIQPLIRVAKNKIENLPGNLRFALSCAEEAIDKAVHDAQIEIEASAEHKLRQIGLEAIGSSAEIDVNCLLDELKTKQLDK